MTARTVEGGFRFRFLVRGRQSTKLLRLALLSLARCHPGVPVVVVDANDDPTIGPKLFGADLDHTIVHLRPGDDAVAKALGRGSRRHLFHWRYSPEVRSALPPFGGFDVHADADLLFLRPLDLAALVEPLGRGRIAAVVDESTLDHYSAVGGTTTSALPGGGPAGPLWQTGLIFSNPTDDGGFHDLVWQAATDAAVTGDIATLPDDDMAIVAAVLGYGGPLWLRTLPLGHDWNYVTDAEKDPSVFGRVAHYGGRRAKEHLLLHGPDLFPPHDDGRQLPWGTLLRRPGTATEPIIRDLIEFPPPDRRPESAPRIPLPFCLTWAVPPRVRHLHVRATSVSARGNCFPSGHSATIFAYRDGQLVDRILVRDDCTLALTVSGAVTLTLVAVADEPDLSLLAHGSWISGDPE